MANRVNTDCAKGRRSAIVAVMRALRDQVPDPAPEELLWLAVIEHAVRDAYAPRTNSDQAREDALKWLESEYFEGVATAIGLHPGWARKQIERISRYSAIH